MKKIRYLILVVLVGFLTGCMDASFDINLNNDGSGHVMFQMALDEEFFDDEDLIEFGDFHDLPDNYEVETINYEKDGSNYFGIKVRVSFDSLEEFNEIMHELSSDDKINVDDGGVVPTITATKDGDIVTIDLPADNDSNEEFDMFAPYINYNTSIKVEGEVISQNASNYDEETKTATWNFEDMAKSGINLVYNTKPGFNFNDILDTNSKEFKLTTLGLLWGGIIVLLMLVIKKVSLSK